MTRREPRAGAAGLIGFKYALGDKDTQRMPKLVKELTASEVDAIVTIGFHAVGGVTGLGVQIVESGAKSWVLRTMIGGKRRKMGLGGYPDVTMDTAKDRARTAKSQIFGGTDPIDARRKNRVALAAKY